MNKTGKAKQTGVEVLRADYSFKKKAALREPMLNSAEVAKMLTICRQNLSAMITKGNFPKPKFYVGARSTAYWDTSTIKDFLKTWRK